MSDNKLPTLLTFFIFSSQSIIHHHLGVAMIVIPRRCLLTAAYHHNIVRSNVEVSYASSGDGICRVFS